jgi:SAM-dependent methyltransferase
MDLKHKTCSICKDKNLKKILSFGMQPLSNNFTKKKNQKLYPLELMFCRKCLICHLSYFVDPKKIFTHYDYMSSISETTINHFEQSIKKITNRIKLEKNKSLIIDLGSNDGISLTILKDLGFKRVLGIEPAKNLASLCKKKNLEVLNKFLDEKVADKLKNSADLLLAFNVFAHTNNIQSLFKNMLRILKINGTIVVQVQSTMDMIKNINFDNIYHEHYYYWTLMSLNNFVKSNNATIVDAEQLSLHGGSIRVFIKKNKNGMNYKSSKRFYKLLKLEKNFSIYKILTYRKFSKKVKDLKNIVINNILELKRKKKVKHIIGYGAPAKASLSINYFNLSKKLEFIIDNNKLKQKKYIPGTSLIIKSLDQLRKYKSVDLIIVLAWNYYKEIKGSLKEFSNKVISIKDLYH